MKHYTRSLFVAVGLFCSDGVNADAVSHHAASVCMANTLGFGPALTKAGMQIDASVESCSGPSKLACAVNVLDVVESCAWVAAYITAAAGDCTKDQNANCENGIADLVASIVAASQASTAIAYSCPTEATVEASPAVAVQQSLDKGKRKTEIGMCVVDSWEAAWSLARAGILINSATINCPAGLETKCTLDALMVTSSILATAHYVLGAVNNCQVGYNHGVACSAAVTKLASALLDISAAAIVIEKTCSPAPGPTTTPSPKNYVEDVHYNAWSRRLANTTQGQHAHQSLSDPERIYLAKSFNMTEEDLAADPMKIIRLMSAKHSSGAISQNASDVVIV